MARVPALLLSLLTVAAGCGQAAPSAAERYAQGVDGVQAELTKAFTLAADDAAPTGTPAADDRTLGRYQRAAVLARARLAALPPPPQARAAHRQLLAAVDGYVEVLDDARTRLSHATVRDVPAVRARLETGLAAAAARIDRARSALDRALRGSKSGSGS